jgi:hypothetical protein
VSALTLSVYAMSKPPADASACPADKACAVKTADSACAEAKAACPMTDVKADAMKMAEEKEGCAGGVCPLKK